MFFGRVAAGADNFPTRRTIRDGSHVVVDFAIRINGGSQDVVVSGNSATGRSMGSCLGRLTGTGTQNFCVFSVVCRNDAWSFLSKYKLRKQDYCKAGFDEHS